MTTQKLTDAKVIEHLAPGLFIPGEGDPTGRLNAGFTGFQVVNFFFDAPGGPDHLLPGGPQSQRKPIDLQPGDSVVFALMAFSGAFISGANLTNRPLGQMKAELSFAPPNFMVCGIRLSDANGDDAIQFYVNGVALFFH
ncbi:hypothetical protein ACIBJC_28330 [Streptomyces sp. NPDC050509]|uniref:hypothetical protein n=1 Tax=Streptomyces sp. NPDC050509 TaxID=3365620 RepID=UPI0037BACEA9